MNKSITHLTSLATALTITATHSIAAPPEPKPGFPHTKSEGVELTLSYNNLRQLIGELQTKQAEKKPTPPVKATIRSAAYQLDIKPGKSAKVTATFSVTTFADGWVTLPLLSDHHSIEKIEPSNIVLIPSKGKLSLLTQGAGEHTIKATLIIPAKPDGSFSLNTVSAISGKLYLGETTGYDVQGATLSNSQDYILPIAGGNIRITPTQKAVTKASTWSADSRVLYVAKDNELQAEARILLHAKEGDAATVANITFPKDSRVISVTGPDLTGWSESGRDQIQLIWNSHGISRRRIVVTYALPLPNLDESWVLNIPRLDDAEQTRGQLAIVTPAEFQLAPTVKTPTLEPGMAADWMKTHGLPVILQLAKAQEIHFKVKRLEQIQTATATIRSAVFKTQIVPDGSTLTEGTVIISHRDPKLWIFNLAMGSKILTCMIDGRAVNPILLTNGALQISLPAKQSKKENTSMVKLSFTTKLEKIQPLKGKLSIALPATPLFIHELQWMIKLPDSYEASALDGNLTFSPQNNPSRTINLVKRLSRNKAAHVDIFYRKKNQ